MTFVEDEHHLLPIDGQIRLALHQVVELLYGGHDDLVVVLGQVAFQSRRALRSVHAVGREALILAHGLVVEILAVDDEKHLVDEVQLRGQSRRLETRERLARSGGVPHIAAPFRATPLPGLVRASDFPDDAFGRRDLIGAHHEQRVAHVEHGIGEQHLQQGVAAKERRREILQVLDRRVVGPRPVHREVETVLLALHRVGEIACVRSVRDHEELQIFVERSLAVETLLAVAVHLVERLADGHAALFEFHLHHRQSVHQDRHVIPILARARLLKLVDHLQFVARGVTLVHEEDVLQSAVVEGEIPHGVILHLARLVGDGVARTVQVLAAQSFPLRIGEVHLVECLELSAHIVAQGLGGAQIGQVFVTLRPQVCNEFVFQLTFGLVAGGRFVQRSVFGIAVQHDEVRGFGDGGVLCHGTSGGINFGTKRSLRNGES